MKKKSMRPLSVVARTACSMYGWFMMAFGAYVIVHGDVTPGGGFQGGSICATFLALMLIAHGSDYMNEWLNDNFYKVCLYLGLFMFIGFGLGIIGSRFLLFFIKLSRHCQRGTAQSTFFLAWEFGLALGIALGYGLLGQQIGPILQMSLCTTVAALLFYHFFTHNWYIRHKNR